MSDLRRAIDAATARLTQAGVGSPYADAIALAAHAAGTDRSEIHRRLVLGAPVPAGFDDLIDARAARVPLQHLTGRAAFRRLELHVGPGVFVPRPETEILVDLALTVLAETSVAGESPVVVDLCTGSGAIALAVKDEAPSAEVHAVEVSLEAHAWAERNVTTTGLDVDLIHADAMAEVPELEHLRGLVDLVTCNPPYVPIDRVPIDPEVRDHDPDLALYGGSVDGLAIPLRLADRAATLLRPGGVLLMEHADEQGESLPAALRARAWEHVTDHADLTGRPRVVRAVHAE